MTAKMTAEPGDLPVDVGRADEQPFHAERERDAQQQQEDCPADDVVGEIASTAS